MDSLVLPTDFATTMVATAESSTGLSSPSTGATDASITCPETSKMSSFESWGLSLPSLSPCMEYATTTFCFSVSKASSSASASSIAPAARTGRSPSAERSTRGSSGSHSNSFALFSGFTGLFRCCALEKHRVSKRHSVQQSRLMVGRRNPN